ncbi:MAG: hypothetical protein Q8N99_07655 [Nanoarchaeota archaeon]|nr:hypothetical protein [Nanoarchaeota archaeon]
MPICSFCRKTYKDPKGLTVFTFDGRAVHFCSSKCRKNHKLGREARNLNWVRRRPDFLKSASGPVDDSSIEKPEIPKEAKKK